MIGAKIQCVRIEKEMSLKELSEKSKVARGYIVELEQGKYKNPGLMVICKLAKALEVTPNDIIPEDLYK